MRYTVRVGEIFEVYDAEVDNAIEEFKAEIKIGDSKIGVIKRNDSLSTGKIALIIFAALYVLILCSAIYGASSGDYRIFNTLTQSLDKGIDHIGMCAKSTKNHEYREKIDTGSVRAARKINGKVISS